MIIQAFDMTAKVYIKTCKYKSLHCKNKDLYNVVFV